MNNKTQPAALLAKLAISGHNIVEDTTILDFVKRGDDI